MLPCILDAGPFDEYKAEYGQTLVCGYGRLGGVAVGVVANQQKRCKPADGPLQFGGVIYVDSADKAARFIMDCNQTRLPLLFLQDVNGFMVGRDSEQAGIIRAGAKLVNVIANSVVPKMTRDPRRLVRRRQLRPVRQGVRSAFHLRLADGPLRRHGRRAGGQHAAGHHRQRPETRRPRAGRRGVGGAAPARSRRATRSRPTSATPRPGCGWTRSSSPPRLAQAMLTALSVAVRHDDGRAFKTGVLQV